MLSGLYNSALLIMTETQELPYFAKKLTELFEVKKTKNRRYSLRAYAKFLSMNPGTLSAIMKGKRMVPLQDAANVMLKLELPPSEQEQFLLSLGVNKPPAESAYKLDASKYGILFDEWEYFVILAVFRLPDFKSTTAWVAQKTGIAKDRVETCLQTLEELSMIERPSGAPWQRQHRNLYSSHDISSKSMQRAHLNTLDMARERLPVIPVQERDYSFVTVALDEKRFKKLKKLVLKFRDDVFELDEQSKGGELYRVALQCFPILNKNE
ncbi:DUF4423 domain-containing protein [Bdellovibrio bacteriovorus]|uniref:DUF4423 domain-containing protein n=1 Tax=Bdellovibrio bacteriovorus TaxID=959 RepID=UPI0021D12CC2|nr:DUF4423 domain-containing protein [Bdellovibrio bacteriovorus]UXR66279.1 DUF4423 domain-containing protein [Bdellovibrio bacteriovorus]